MKHLTAALLFACSTQLSAADLTIGVGDNPPFNWSEKGQPQGMAAHITTELFKRAGLSIEYVDQPWARVFQNARSEPNFCAFTLGRIPEREAWFQWVGPIAYNKWALFALRSRKLELGKLEDAGKLRIGGQNKDAKATWLESRGYQLDYGATEDQSMRKLFAGRIDLYPAGLLTGPIVARRLGLDAGQLQPLLVFNQIENYLGCSLSTDRSKIFKLQKALLSMQKDKTLEKIWDDYEHEVAP